jgi:hypothetical protein
MSDQFDVQTFVNKLVDKMNKQIKEEKEFNDRVESYGAVQLYDGTVVKIKKNFYFLEQLWQMYTLYKAFGNEEQFKQVIVDTNGGLFDCGDVVLKLEDVKLLFRSQKYNNSSEEEKENMLFKDALINNHLDETLYTGDFGDGDFDDDEDDYE